MAFRNRNNWKLALFDDFVFLKNFQKLKLMKMYIYSKELLFWTFGSDLTTIAFLLTINPSILQIINYIYQSMQALMV